MNLSEMKLGERVTIEAVPFTGCNDCAITNISIFCVGCPKDLMFAIVPQPEQPQDWRDKILQARANGKVIQFRSNEQSRWIDETPGSRYTLDCDEHQYRIKPEPKYRPLNAQEMRELVGKVILFGKDVYLVQCYDADMNVILVLDSWVGTDLLMQDYTYPDGKPVAAEVSE